MISQSGYDFVYDAGPTGCGELIMNLFITLKKMECGQVIKVISYDPGAREDIPAWCRLQNHSLIRTETEGKVSHYYIQKN